MVIAQRTELGAQMICLIGDQDCGRSRLADSEAHEMSRIHLVDRANQRPKRLHPRLYAKEESVTVTSSSHKAIRDFERARPAGAGLEDIKAGSAVGPDHVLDGRSRGWLQPAACNAIINDQIDCGRGNVGFSERTARCLLYQDHCTAAGAIKI